MRSLTCSQILRRLLVEDNGQPTHLTKLKGEKNTWMNAGGSEGVFRRPWTRGQSRRWSALGDDRPKRNRVRGRITRSDVRGFERALPHALRSAIECVAVAGAFLHHRRSPSQKTHRKYAAQPCVRSSDVRNKQCSVITTHTKVCPLRAESRPKNYLIEIGSRLIFSFFFFLFFLIFFMT